MHCTAEQIRPAFWSDDSKQRVLKELGGGPNPGIPDSQSRNAGRLQLITRREELFDGHLVTNLDSVLFEQFSVVPKQVPPMDAREYGIDLSILGHQIDYQLLRKSRIPSVTFVQLGNRFAVTGFYVLAKQFPTGMGLPSRGASTARRWRLQFQRQATAFCKH